MLPFLYEEGRNPSFHRNGTIKKGIEIWVITEILRDNVHQAMIRDREEKGVWVRLHKSLHEALDLQDLAMDLFRSDSKLMHRAIGFRPIDIAKGVRCIL